MVRDIFLVSLEGHQEGCVWLAGLARDVRGQSFLANDTLFDSLLFERLQLPQTNILAYLSECYDRAEYQKGKPWNESP